MGKVITIHTTTIKKIVIDSDNLEKYVRWCNVMEEYNNLQTDQDVLDFVMVDDFEGMSMSDYGTVTEVSAQDVKIKNCWG